MTRPDFAYHWTRAINPRTGKPGTRYNLTGWQGPGCYAPLVGTLKTTGEPVVYVNKNQEKAGTTPNERRPENGLFLPPKGNEKNGKQISGIYMPSPEHPGLAYGDAGGGRPGPDALLIRWNLVTGTLTVFVFLGLGPQAEMLFLSWITGPAGGVSEELAPAPSLLGGGGFPPSPPGSLYNNVHLATDIET